MIHVWRIDAATPQEARAARDALLAKFTAAPLVFDRSAKGKPYLPGAPGLKFNLSRSKGRALVAVADEIEVGVDIERLRPLPDLSLIAERYLPPGDAKALAQIPAAEREREFFRCWTRAEALWKAAGLGLYSAGALPDGDWHVQDIDAGEGYAAAIAANRPCLPVTVKIFGVEP